MIKTILLNELRFLTFRRVSPEVQANRRAFLAFGLFVTWLAGIGRYWDNPRAERWQALGLGSLAYVFLLALFLWGLLAPLRPRSWSYLNVLLFLTLTAPPALLYAIPVEKFLAPEAARDANVWLLAIVSMWRVALLVVFLSRTGGLSAGQVIVATLLPLSLIIITLSILNLEHVVFNIMGGIRPGDRSPHDKAYQVVFFLSLISFFLAPILGIAYVIMAMLAKFRIRRAQKDPTS